MLVTAADTATLRRARRVYRHDQLVVIDGIGDALSRCAKARFDVIICGLARDAALAGHFVECLEILNPTLTPRIVFLG